MDETFSQVHDRVLAVFEGRIPDRIPFIDRMDFWYKGCKFQGTLPTIFQDMSVSDIHKSIGFGHQDWQYPYTFKYRNLEMVLIHEGEEIYHENNPEITNFPTLWGMVPIDKPGITTTKLITPLGTLSYQHKMIHESLITGTTRPYMISRPIQEESDYLIYEYIIEHSEFCPRFNEFFEQEKTIGSNGYLVPIIERIPFQHLLIDAIGEIETFYTLHDNPKPFERLLYVLDLQVRDKLYKLADFNVPYIEFTDNLDGIMTNPILFKKYFLPHFQSYSEIAHKQNKLLGSHTDGDLNPLIQLLPDSGIDVCESFTPTPITSCPFDAAFKAWEKGPVIWGGLPSYYLEERVSEDDLLKYVDGVLQTVGNRPFILGIGDAVMSDNIIERVRLVADIVEDHRI